MSVFIKKYKAKNGATVVQVVYKNGRTVINTVHIGTAHTDEELDILVAKAKEVIRGDQLAFDFEDKELMPNNLLLERTYSKLLWDTLFSVYTALGFDVIADEVFKQLVIARIIEPTSKLDTIRVLSELGLNAPSNSGIHRSLKRVIKQDYRDVLSRCCLSHVVPDKHTLLLYDVTTLYFEIQKEDDYRIPGLSKERRLEPQITVGLLVDAQGFPLEVQSFEGNKAETKTIIPVVEAFVERHGLGNVTIVADAAMLSAQNLTELERLGCTYVVGSRIAKTPYAIDEYLKSPGVELEDMQIFDSWIETTIDHKRQKRRVVYQYRQKRASLDLRNIDKAIAKAQKMVEGKANAKRNRFLQLKDAKPTLNTALIEEAKRKAGIKGYVPNLDISAQLIIDAYHQLFQVEKSFRMSKSDLKARPIFHHTKDSIEAHLTIVFAALAMSRYVEEACQVSIKKFVRELSIHRTGVLLVNGVRLEVEPVVSEKAISFIDSLKPPQSCE